MQPRELIERESDLARIDSALARALDGDGAVVFIEGPAGIGKTELVAAAARAGEDAGARVLRAVGGEFERRHAHGVVRQLFEPLLVRASEAERAELLAGAAGLAAPAVLSQPLEAMPDEGSGVLHGLYWLTANLAEGCPLVVCIDDAHWCDEPSLAFAHYLARRLEGLGVLLVLAARPVPADPNAELLAALALAAGEDRIVPAALSADGVGRLVAARLGDADVAFVAACHAATGGNPFFAGELIHALAADGRAPTAAAAAEVAALAPPTVARSILLRLGALPPAAARLAEVIALLGHDARLDDAAQIAGIDLGSAREAVDALARIHILAPDGTLEFAHPIVRTAVADDMPAAECRLVHEQAARLLHERGMAAGRVAQHLLYAPPGGNAWACAALRAAAREAIAQGASASAVELLARALAEPPPPDERHDVLAELGHAELLAGAFADACGHLAESLEAPCDPHTEAARALDLARGLLATEGAAVCIEQMAAAVERLRPRDAEVAAAFEADMVTVATLYSVPVEAIERRLDRAAEIAGESAAECQTLAGLAWLACFEGSPAAIAADLAWRALRNGALLNGPAGVEGGAFHQAAYVLLYTDELERAAGVLDDAIANARRRGSATGYAGVSTARALHALRRGDVPAAEAEARGALEAADHALTAPLAVAFLVEALVERGELEEADALLTGRGLAGELAPVGPFASVLEARAALRLAQGRPADALADARALAPADDGVPLPAWRPLAALAHAALGDEQAAIDRAAEAVELARGWGTPRAVGQALRVRALVEGGPDAIALADEAVGTLERSGAKLELARAFVDAGRIRRRHGRRAEARELLQRGLDLARRCGATALARRAHDDLRAAGAKPRRLAFSGVESLTASERRVADLAAEGLSNREIAQALFVTAKTVENHLGRVYMKLGIHSRAELGSALAEVG
jgi:DNA-binding CsgD family transcriptional regulator